MIQVVKPPLIQRLIPDGPLRAALRSASLTTLGWMSRSKTSASLQVPRVQNLYLHFLPEADESRFLKLITILSRDHTFVSYSEAVERATGGPIDKPYLSISFDDGFESNRRAAELLAGEGISACFFICPNLIGLQRHELLRVFPTSLGQEQRTLTWSEVDRILTLGHEVGSHTLDHFVLADIPHEVAVQQIEGSKVALESHIGRVEHFAWPNGQFHHFGEDLARATFSAGYTSCSSAVRGAHLVPSGSGVGCLRRENVVASWPLEHIFYLLGRSVRYLSQSSGKWPAGWMDLESAS